MKTAAGLTVQSILLVILAALLAIPLACLATLTAPLHSPGFASPVLCPPGSQVESEWYRATYNEPGERTLSVTCVDAQGSPVAANPRDEKTLLNGIQLYFPVCLAPLLALGALVLIGVNLLVKGRRRRQPGQMPG